MGSVLSRAGGFVAIIFMGWLLRQKGFFKEGDFLVLSKIVLRITLPAAVVSSFSGKVIDPKLLGLCFLGLVCGASFIAAGALINLRATKDQRAFEMLNIASYNIGSFTIPFAQSFLGPIAVITIGLFDIGNSMLSMGGAYSIAANVKNGGKFSVGNVLKSVFRSVPFDTYLVMITLSMLHIKTPTPVLEFAGIIANGNAFLSMLMLGVGFKLSGDHKKIGTIGKIIFVRYALTIVLAVLCYRLLPLGIEYRKAIVLVLFSPIASSAAAFTADLKGDIGLASAINSISIVVSLVCMISMLPFMI